MSRHTVTWDAERGPCTAMSAAATLDAVRAFKFER
jgi:hypothetical protein